MLTFVSLCLLSLSFSFPRYMFLRADDESIHGKKGGEAGITICKTNTAMVIGTYST